MKILLFSPNITDFFTQKVRASLAEQKDVECVVVGGFLREESSMTVKSPIMGIIESRKYFNRIYIYIKTLLFLPFILRRYDAVYSNSIDTAFLAFISAKLSFNRRLKFIYGYSDVHGKCTSSGFSSKIARGIECFMASHAYVTVFTSTYFFTEYFQKRLKCKVRRHLMIENKISPAFAEKMKPETFKHTPMEEKIRFGYVGILSYIDTFKFLSKAADDGLKIRLYGNLFLPSEAGESNIEFCGKYKNPDDIGDIFSNIDASLILLDFKEGTNTQWQMTNRFYDALLMETPIIIQKGAAHSDFVEEHDIGLLIDIYKPEESIKLLSDITSADIIKWRENIKKLNPNSYLLSDEYSKLVEIISE